jgi:HAD superfamily hydrolase (TIGR01509 family)
VLVIFDCDGVLVDSEPLSCRSLSEALHGVGLPISPQECSDAFIGRSWMSVEAIVAERLGRAVPASLQADYRTRMTAAFEAELEAVPGIGAAIDAVEAMGHATCVASSGPLEKMRHSLGLTGLYERFDGRIFSAWDVPNGKPAPDLFLHAAATMGFDPEDVAVVEDAPVGIEAARAARMRAIGYAGRTERELLGDADVVIADMADLVSLLGCAAR